MLNVTPLTKCTFEEVLTLWNEGFQGYVSDMTFSMERLLGRFGLEDISAELSVVAWDGSRPVGFIMNGMRVANGQRIVWNGGTAVVPSHRRRGVGRTMFKACLDMYRHADADAAYLEAVLGNEPAIKLYQQFGYRPIDRVVFLTHSASLCNDAFRDGEVAGIGDILEWGVPQRVASLPFYKPFAPWQTQWQSLHGAESLTLRTQDGIALGYVLVKRRVGDAGHLESISVYQCEVNPEVADVDGVMSRLLGIVYGPLETPCQRVAVNLPESNVSAHRALRSAGFKTHLEQVMMKLQLKE